jgi:hypothetical protein
MAEPSHYACTVQSPLGELGTQPELHSMLVQSVPGLKDYWDDLQLKEPETRLLIYEGQGSNLHL